MLDQICAYLKNWFDRNQPKYIGDFAITNGQITFLEGDMQIQQGQYFRVIGSVFNDGVWKYGTDPLTTESFNGAVWLMAVPPALISLSKDIEDWSDKYLALSGHNMSPFSSESFGGYSYTKSQGASGSDDGSSTIGWQSAFASRLVRWKKL